MRTVLIAVLFAAVIALPDDLAKYRKWPELLDHPHEVPIELYLRCVAPAPSDWDEARKQYGPHTKMFIRVYGNDAAAKALAARRALPRGSVVVKEKLAGTERAAADGVAFMVKRNTPELADSGGWEFLYFPAPPDPKAAHRACAACHQAAQRTDYVFGQYPR